MTEGIADVEYRRIAAALKQRIVAGEFPPGSQIPALPKLMNEYGATIYPVREALKVLRGEGFIRTIQGKGTFVADEIPETSDEYQGVMRSLAEVREELYRLAARVEQLEAAGPTRAPRRDGAATSPRRAAQRSSP